MAIPVARKRSRTSHVSWHRLDCVEILPRDPGGPETGHPGREGAGVANAARDRSRDEVREITGEWAPLVHTS